MYFLFLVRFSGKYLRTQSLILFFSSVPASKIYGRDHLFPLSRPSQQLKHTDEIVKFSHHLKHQDPLPLILAFKQILTVDFLFQHQ